MRHNKKKPLLNRKETQSLLTTLKVISTAGALTLTLTGWGLLAQREINTAQAAPNQPAALVESSVTAIANNIAPTPIAQTVKKLNVVRWVRDVQGNPVAVVQDKRGSLWYVMGSDVPRLEQGLSPQVQPQLVQVVTRTRAS